MPLPDQFLPIQQTLDLLGKKILFGNGSPNGRRLAKGSVLYIRNDAVSASTVLYVHSDATESTNWTAVTVP